jgi:hypothetical protein
MLGLISIEGYHDVLSQKAAWGTPCSIMQHVVDARKKKGGNPIQNTK